MWPRCCVCCSVLSHWSSATARSQQPASQPIMPHHLIWASVSLYYTTFADNVTSHITLRSNYGTFKGRCVGGSAEVERLLHNMKQSCGKALKDFCGRLYVQYVGIVNCSDVSCAKRGEFSVCVKWTVALLLDVIILEPVIDNLLKQTTSPGRPLTSATLLAEIRMCIVHSVKFTPYYIQNMRAGGNQTGLYVLIFFCLCPHCCSVVL